MYLGGWLLGAKGSGREEQSTTEWKISNSLVSMHSLVGIKKWRSPRAAHFLEEFHLLASVRQPYETFPGCH
jgi:hypothetical protein